MCKQNTSISAHAHIIYTHICTLNVMLWLVTLRLLDMQTWHNCWWQWRRPNLFYHQAHNLSNQFGLVSDDDEVFHIWCSPQTTSTLKAEAEEVQVRVPIEERNGVCLWKCLNTSGDVWSKPKHSRHKYLSVVCVDWIQS